MNRRHVTVSPKSVMQQLTYHYHKHIKLFKSLKIVLLDAGFSIWFDFGT